MSQEKKLEYAVIIYRKDEQHIIIDSGTDYEECKKLHTKLDKQWEESHKEQVPFRLQSPEVTSFEPGLVKEIKIVANHQSTMNVESHNPYVQKMNREGFSNSFPKSAMLDGGYR